MLMVVIFYVAVCFSEQYYYLLTINASQCWLLLVNIFLLHYLTDLDSAVHL